MIESPLSELDPRHRRRLIAAVLLRALLTSAALVATYYILPIDPEGRLSGGVRLLVASLLFILIVAWQIRTILGSRRPGIRAIEALAATIPLYVLFFASTYFLMSSADPASFSEEQLSRTDSLYLAVTIFASVGFGDITATSESARVVVISQMILNLFVLGFGINAFVHAARVGRQRQSS